MPDDLSAFYEGELVFNGINAITAEYGQPPLSSQELARLIRGAPLPEDYRRFVNRQKQLAAVTSVEDRLQRVTDAQRELRVKADEIRLGELRFKAQTQTPWPVIPGAGSPTDIANVGWAVIFPADMNPGIREEIKVALQPLLTLRRDQAGDLFRLLEGTGAYRAGERKDQYFERMGVGPGLADPRELPFYVLLIGSPEEIPYSFQYQLDVMRGVGRLDFGSDVDAYAAYAQTIVAAETGGIQVPRRAAFWAPNNAGDKATEMSGRLLVQPLFENLQQAAPALDVALTHEWDVLPSFAGPSGGTRNQLEGLLGGDTAHTPGLLFTASHGLEFPADHPLQLSQQGALLCQDWPGLGNAILRDHYFAAEDVDAGADLSGMMAVFFACYGVGTPELDQFAVRAFQIREKIAPRSFTAALPQRLLRQGALAVLGHVERAWGYSFISPQGRLENQAFITAMRTLMNGDPIGVATDLSFNMRYAEMSSDLSADLEELQWNPEYLSERELTYRWTANNDARSYVVLGDPAARLPFGTSGLTPEMTQRPDLGTIAPPPQDLTASSGQPDVPETAPDEDDGAVSAEPDASGAVDAFVSEPVSPTVPVPPEEATPAEPAEETVIRGVTAPPAPPEVVPEAPKASQAPEALEAPEASQAEAQAWERARGAPVPAASVWPAPDTRPEAAIGYGLEDQFDKLKVSLKAFTDQLATSLGNAAEDIVTLDVRTYSTVDIGTLAEAMDQHQEFEATLRALTRVAFDGDVQVYVPQEVGKGADAALWEIHKAMVEEAQRSRASFLATMAELATRLLDTLKIGL